MSLALAAAAAADRRTPPPAPPDGVSPFGLPDPGADFETLSDFRLGSAVFRQVWTPAGEGAAHFDGLGPLYNARSCDGCHARDGRGRPPPAGGGAYPAASMILRLARAGEAADSGMAPDPVYGRQLQDAALAGFAPEGRLRVDYAETAFVFADGETAMLRRPRFSIADAAHGPPHAATVASARIAPAMIGAGLIERIPAGDIIAGADPDDRDGDGISGRANLVDAGGAMLAVGRFGWKAAQPDLESQISTALSLDMGIATARHPAGYGDCTAAEAACRAAPDGATPAFESLEAHSVIVGWLVRYAANLAVPAPRGVDGATVAAGKALFADIGCAACHRPAFTTAPDPDQPHLGNRRIAPYSDFLLHHMGEGLADGLAEGRAAGGEWRTQPLWGIGLTREVNGNTAFLHDGRARSLTEAILWHGGEAAAARQAFAALDAASRARLIAFLDAL